MKGRSAPLVHCNGRFGSTEFEDAGIKPAATSPLQWARSRGLYARAVRYRIYRYSTPATVFELWNKSEKACETRTTFGCSIAVEAISLASITSPNSFHHKIYCDADSAYR